MEQKHPTISLPEGWVVETRTRKVGKLAGRSYKQYYDPATGVRCYSMKEVLRHLKSGVNVEESGDLSRKSASRKRKNYNIGSTADAHVQFESSPNGLPPGWIKEIRCTKNASGQRKDAYYKDPVTGYVFRSKKDVFRYLETGEIGKSVFKFRRKFKRNIMPSTMELLPNTEGQCLSVNHGEPSVKIPGHNFPQSVQDYCPDSDFNNREANKVEAEDIAEVRAYDGNPDLVQQVKSVPVSRNLSGLNRHESYQPAGSIRVDSMARKPSPGKRFKMLARRRPFRKKGAGGETKVDKEQSESETSDEMDLSEQPSPSLRP